MLIKFSEYHKSEISVFDVLSFFIEF